MDYELWIMGYELKDIHTFPKSVPGFPIWEDPVY